MPDADDQTKTHETQVTKYCIYHDLLLDTGFNITSLHPIIFRMILSAFC